jgi:hypothetical protein
MPIYLLFGIAVLESRELQKPKVRTVEKQEFAHLNSLTLEIERIDLAAEIVGADRGFFFGLWRLKDAYLLPGLKCSDFDMRSLPIEESMNARMRDGK